MPYDPDPLQKALDKRFRFDGENYFFGDGDREGALPVSEDDVWLAKETLRTYSARAKVIGLILLGGSLIGYYWMMAMGRSMISAGLIAAFFIFVIPLSFNLLALSLIFRPLKRRLRSYQRQQLGWKPKGWLRALRELNVPLPGAIIALIMLMVFVPLRTIELKLRADIIDYGIPIVARVDKSDDRNAKHICIVKFSYAWHGLEQSGEAIGCDLMKSHPVGSPINARILPDRPEYVIAESEGWLTADVAWPLIVAVLFGFCALGVAVMAHSYAPPE